MSNQTQNLNDKKHDLAKRTGEFGEEVIVLAANPKDNPVSRPLTSQLVRSAISIGANYMEADGAESKKDFLHKIEISKKEAKETTHWLRMVSKSNPVRSDDCRKLWKETRELVPVFSTIINNSKK